MPRKEPPREAIVIDIAVQAFDVDSRDEVAGNRDKRAIAGMRQIEMYVGKRVRQKRLSIRTGLQCHGSRRYAKIVAEHHTQHPAGGDITAAVARKVKSGGAGLVFA